MSEVKSFYEVDPKGQFICHKCGIPLVKSDAVFGYLNNAFPVEMPVCPKCGKPMLKRMARKGINSGKEFWSCSGYPACRGTRNVE